MVDGPRKFMDFQYSLAHISPTTHSDRLKSLEEHSIIDRRFYEDHTPGAEYLLTSKGEDLRPILRAMRLCGEYIPDVDRITACMVQKYSSLSDGCKSVFQAPQAAPTVAPAAPVSYTPTAKPAKPLNLKPNLKKG